MLLALICSVAFALADVEINETNFPDANFRQYIIDAGFDTDGNGTLSEAEIGNVTGIRCNQKSISSLAGIEFFTALNNLDCPSNQLTSLDVSKNTALTSIRCSSNQLTNLNVSKNTALTVLWCNSNQLTNLDVKENEALAELRCDDNLLTSLDVSHNTALTTLRCDSTQLTSLDVSGCTALTKLNCKSNQLTSLDVSKNSALTSLDCSFNQLTSLDLTNNTTLLEEIAKYGFRVRESYIQIGHYDEEWSGWRPLVLAVDKTVSVLPEGTIPETTPEPTFILPAATTTIESEAFTGLTNQVFQLPITVTFIADDAFDSTAKVLAPKDSYAETRCKELGLKVYTIE